jgi:hypothetical protein
MASAWGSYLEHLRLEVRARDLLHGAGRHASSGDARGACGRAREAAAVARGSLAAECRGGAEGG